MIKSSAIKPVDDRGEHENIRTSRWFMSIFLRFMLSDGAGAMLLEDKPAPGCLSLRVDWTHSLSLANQAPLCMKLESHNSLLSQDVSVLSAHLFPAAGVFLDEAFRRHNDSIDAHTMVLPHMSSLFFRRKLERTIAGRCADPLHPTPYWTNLATAGNTGAASIYVMLDHYLQSQTVKNGVSFSATGSTANTCRSSPIILIYDATFSFSIGSRAFVARRRAMAGR